MADRARNANGQFAKQIDNTLRRIEDSASPNQIELDGQEGRGGVTFDQKALREGQDEQFPTSGLQQKDKRDALMAAKLSLQDPKSPGTTPFGVLTMQDRDLLWLQRKREMEAKANFEQWCSTNFDQADPVHKKWMREALPWYFQERQRQLEKNIALQKRLAEIKLHGIQDKEDIMLEFAKEQGLIDTATLDNIMHPEKVKDAQDRAARLARYKRGLLNPRRLVNGDWGQRERKDNAAAALGKDPSKIGETYRLGLDAGFSATGPMTSGAKGGAGAYAQFQFLKDALTGAGVAPANAAPAGQ